MRMISVNQAFTTPRLWFGAEPNAVRGLILLCSPILIMAVITDNFFPGLFATIGFFLIMLAFLRRIAAYDPIYFAVMWRWIVIDQNGIRIRPSTIPARPRYLPAEPWK